MEKRHKYSRYWITYVLVLLAFCSTLCAQSERARILGRVTDPNGAVLPGTAVTVTNVATGVSTSTKTDQEGQYQAPELPIGTYRVKAAHDGFKTTETATYTLEINQVLRIDVKLPIGTTGETVEVTGEATLVETVNPTLGASVTAAPIVNLPLDGRNVLDLALLQPGVTPSNPDDGGAGTFNIAGARADSVTFLLDGGVDNDLLDNGVVFTPNPDAVQEFRILTSNYTAEYGRNAGGIVSVVTKSGTNTIHGSVFEFNRNDTFAANKYFNNKNSLSKDTLNRNQYGVTVGGPIIKNKLFWFTSYEGQKLEAGDSRTISTFTPAMLNGDFSHASRGPDPNVVTYVPDPNIVAFLNNNPYFQPNAALRAQAIIDPTKIDPVAKNYIAAGLIPTSATAIGCDTVGVCAGTLFSRANSTNNFNEFQGKIDFIATEKDSLVFTAGGRRRIELRPFQSTNITSPAGPGFPGSYVTHSYFSGFDYIHTFTTNALNEFHLTLQRYVNNQAVPAKTQPFPSTLGVGITPDQSTGPTRLSFESNLLIGFSPQGPTALVNNTISYADTFSWTRGRHNWKIGASFIPYQNNTVYDFYVNGQFDFDNFNGTFNQYANMLLGMPEDYFQFGRAPSNIRQKSSYGFIQDEWHAQTNLVLTIGVRYEYGSPKADTQGRSFSLIRGAQSTRFVNAPPGLLFPGDRGAPRGANFPDKNDWAPRLGIAWDPFKDGKTSVRGGVGMFYDVLKGEDNLQFNGQAPFFGFTNPTFVDCPDLPPNPDGSPQSGSPNCVTSTLPYMSNPFAGTVFSGGIGTPNPFPSRPPAPDIDFGAAGFLPFGGGGVYTVNPNLRTPYIFQYNLNIQHELMRNLALETGYVGSQSRKLTTLVDDNPFDPTSAPAPGKLPTHRIFNELGSSTDDFRFSYFDTFENAVNANYSALETKLSKRSSETRYLGTTYFTLSYTWAHSIDNSSGFRNRNNQIPYFQRNAFRGSSDYDVRQRISFSGGWELPFDHAWESGPKRLTSGWSAFPIVTWRTGFPLNVLAQFLTTRSNPGPSGAGDAGIVNARLTGPIKYFDPNTSTPGSVGNKYFDGSVFTTSGLAGTGGNVGCQCYGSGRDILRGPGRTNFDFALAKKTSITERTALELRAEFFNLFNHPEFNNPVVNVGDSATFGQVIDTAPARLIQFGARFTF